MVISISNFAIPRIPGNKEDLSFQQKQKQEETNIHSLCTQGVCRARPFFSLSLNNFFEMFKIGMHVEEGLYGLLSIILPEFSAQ